MSATHSASRRAIIKRQATPNHAIIRTASFADRALPERDFPHLRRG